MAAGFGVYNYTYGAGSQENRQIQFSMTTRGTFQAQVYILLPTGNLGAPLSIIQGDHINIEMENTTQKAHLLATGQKASTHQLLSSFSGAQQNAIIGSLAPLGSRRIAVRNTPIFPGCTATPTSLLIFDPT